MRIVFSCFVFYIRIIRVVRGNIFMLSEGERYGEERVRKFR